MPPDSDKSYIEELKKKLYSRTAPDVRTRRKLRYSEEKSDVKTDWEHPPEEDLRPKSLNDKYMNPRMSFFTKLFIASIIFCIVAVGIGAYLFFNGANLISANNIDISINGPVSIPGGTPVSYDIVVANNNKVDLQTVDMSVDFPSGSVDPANPSVPLTNYTKMIGDIPTGGSAKSSADVIMYGEENLEKEINVTITYSVKGSSVPFTKNKVFDVLINSSPIGVTISSFDKITSGQEFGMTVNVKSNSGGTLKDLLLTATYPSGYSLISSAPASLSDNTTWKLGNLAAGATKSVTLHGKLSGEDSDLRAFHFTVGTEGNPGVIGTAYMAAEQDVTIEKPFISLTMPIDGDSGSGDHNGKFGQGEEVDLDWFNNLSVSVSNVSITMKLSGTAYDKTHVQAGAGYFDSAHDTITWSRETNPELASIGPGESGKVTFSVTPTDPSASGNPAVDPKITFSANVSGTRAQEANVPQSVSVDALRNTKVITEATLSGRVLRTTGPFVNAGPVPPVAEQPTTYTVVWDVDNTSNAIQNAAVTASLPPYVKWLGTVSPSTENVRFDQSSGVITWNVGDVGTYTLNSSGRREVAFQISFTPSVDQINQIPTLVNQASLTALDTFTNAQVNSSQSELSTRFSTDPNYTSGQETVVKQ